jgi:hypothetical protein
MGSLADFAENGFLNHVFGSAFTPAAAMYLALCTADPTDAATGASMSEVANSNNYTRKAITFAAAGSRAVAQTGAVTFNQASGAWGTITHWAVVDNATYGSGNVLATGAFSSSFAPVAGNTPSVATGQVTVTISAVSNHGFTTYLANKMLDLMFRNVAFSQPATYVALLDQTGADADTTLTTAGKEVAGTAYARVLVNKAGGASPKWTAVATGALDNADAINFTTVGSGGWSTVVGMALVDGGTLDAGNTLAYDNDNVVDQTPAAGDTVSFAVGALDVSLS